MLEKTKLLYVEDDLMTAEIIVDFLQGCGFEVEFCDTITSALSLLQQKEFQLLLLDLTLPDFSGLELIKKVRQSQNIPMIVLSAHSEVKTKVTAFRYGANDYMVKPISLEELEARIWALLGRFSQIQTQDEIQKEMLYIKDNTLFFRNEALDLTQIEFDILSLLLKNKNKVLSRELLSSSLSSISSHRSLDYHIKNIRKKLKDDSSSPHYLKTQYGVGYKLVI